MIAPKDEEEATTMMASVSALNPTPEEATAHEELRCAVQRAIRGLTPKLRDALLLAQAGEYTYDDIAAMLGAPVGTIKWRVSEARRMVRKTLRAEGHGDV